jgi:hypothetical protein
MEDMG